jgi:hypothetical protein
MFYFNFLCNCNGQPCVLTPSMHYDIVVLLQKASLYLLILFAFALLYMLNPKFWKLELKLTVLKNGQ